MKKRSKQIGIMILGLLLAFGYIFLSERIYFGPKEAEEKVEAYTAAHSFEEKQIDMKYDWYSGGGYIGEGYRYNPDLDMIIDEAYQELWKPYFMEYMEEAEGTFEGNVVLDDYGWIRYYDGEAPETYYDDMFLYGIYDTSYVSEEESIARGAEVITEILQYYRIQGYYICGIHMTYYNQNGTYQYSVPLSQELITKEMVEAAGEKVSYENNSLLLEKWEAFFNQKQTFWTVDGADYKVSLKGWEDAGEHQLLLEQNGIETLIKTYDHYDGEVEEMKYGRFADILGYDGFYVYAGRFPSVGEYFAVENGTAFCIADTAGVHDTDCFAIDVDGDGVTEFINNCLFGDGWKGTKIYHRDGEKILTGWCDDMLDVEYENSFYMAEYSQYLPEEKVVEIFYFVSEEEGYSSKKYEIDLEKINFGEYETELINK